MCAILKPFIFTENWVCHLKGCSRHIKKIIKQCQEFIKIWILKKVYKMLQGWRLSHSVFNIFTANILGMWEKWGGFTPMQGCSPPLLSHYDNGLFQIKPNRGKGGWGQTFLKTSGIFRFFLYPWKFQTKQGFTRRNSAKLCYIPQKL